MKRTMKHSCTSTPATATATTAWTLLLSLGIWHRLLITSDAAGFLQKRIVSSTSLQQQSHPKPQQYTSLAKLFMTESVSTTEGANRRNVRIDSRPISSSSSSSSSIITRTNVGDWEELHGNYLLRPAPELGPPRALLHFLGGAFIGAAPHLSYRYVLERLAKQGYLVVATPFQLSFDHLRTCDGIIERFERIAPLLARQYGGVPVVGVGHSLGALLQLLITSLFPDTPRAANVLLSFNNKPVKDAIPLFDEFIVPTFTILSARNGTLPSGSEALSLSLRLAKAATEGQVPSNELLTEIVQFVTPPPFRGAKNSPIFPDQVVVPSALRDTINTFFAPSTLALTSAGVLPFFNQVIETLEQVPLLIDEVAEGARDFIPNPDAVRTAARRAYRARRTLILQYDQDTLDESDEIEQLLREAQSVTRMKRPMVDIDVQRRVLQGGHAAPVIAPPLDVTQRAEDILGVDSARERLLYAQADATVDELVRWLEEGSL